MRYMTRFIAILASAFLLSSAYCLERVELSVDGLPRVAYAYIPADSAKTSRPIIFAFHGHGGTMKTAARQFECEKYWPEAIVVYPQGLDTPRKLTDPEGKKTGWQGGIGDMADRDLKFFDALLAYLKGKYSIDEKRIYSTGHSNGGEFTYLLWAARGELLAAVAPIAAILGNGEDLKKLAPKPAFHVAGKNDLLVRYAWQERMINYIKSLNGCADGVRGSGEYVTEYPSTKGAPLFTFIHDGGHELPNDAIPHIVRFFKENALP